jgi:hypothetical protein
MNKRIQRKVSTSVIRRRVAHVRTYIWEENIASIIRVERLSELETVLAVDSCKSHTA